MSFSSLSEYHLHLPVQEALSKLLMHVKKGDVISVGVSSEAQKSLYLLITAYPGEDMQEGSEQFPFGLQVLY